MSTPEEDKKFAEEVARLEQIKAEDLYNACVKIAEETNKTVHDVLAKELLDILRL